MTQPRFPRQYRELRRVAERSGWTVSPGRKHWHWRDCEGRLVVVTSRSPNDSKGREDKNMIAALRRAGLPV